MKLQIERPIALALFERCAELDAFRDQLKIANRVELPLGALDARQLDTLAALYREGGTAPGKAAQLQALAPVVSGADARFAEGELEAVVPALIEHLLHGARHGWLFRFDPSGLLKPYLVSRIDFTPAGNEESARLVLELKANSCGKLDARNLVIGERDLIGGQSLAALLASKGYLCESDALLDAYERTLARYYDWRVRFAEQFSGRGVGLYAEDPAATHRSTDWARKSLVVLSANGSAARLVNDEAILNERELAPDSAGHVLAHLLRRMERNGTFSRDTERRIEALAAALPAGLFTRVPIHPYILMFHLDLHHHLWVHVEHLQPYAYQPELRHKLVLPPEHVDLIDILTAEMDLLMDDIVEGKSGGTTVLCTGPAGVGKTLTAEVYAEIIKRPLYRVHSGQLGLNVAEMEKALKEALMRAQRWGAVMLIDEADVYIKRRDDNLAMNAVVGVFLRVLEYFNGLLFLTTNRMHDIDEAIVSRCIAMIRYSAPSEDERARIWAVMAEQFALPLEPALRGELARRFPHASGRDIKGLAKLVAKYCSHKSVPPSLAVFDHCALFRGMDSGRAAA